MQRIRSQLDSLSIRINGLSLRERALVFLAVLAIMVSGWNSLIYSGHQKERKQLQQRLNAIEARQEAVKRANEEIEARDRVDPNVDLRHQLETLHVRLQELETRKQALAHTLIPPQRMAGLLQDLLKAEGSLRFISLETAPAAAILGPEGKEVASVGVMPGVFRHDLTIEFEGEYFDMLGYLRELERQAIFWDSIDYRVRTYPQASVRLKVYTLSFEREWLGV